MGEFRPGGPEHSQSTRRGVAGCRRRRRAERERRYRAMGWWSGERLCERYAVLAQRLESRLAVADATGRRLSHGRLWREGGRLAEKLRAGGIGHGDIVILLLPNIVEGQVAFVALLRLGAVPASLPTRTDPETLAHAARLTGARALVSLERHGTARLGEIAREAASTCGHEPGVFLLDDSAGTWRTTPPGRGAPLPASAADLAHIMFTSSTTGRPKAVMHSDDTLAALNIGFTERFSLGPDAPIFLASPLGHSIGAIHGLRLSLHTGAPLVLQDVWDPERALEAIEAFGCAFTAAATPFLKDLVDASWPRPTPKLAPLRSFLCGGAQVPPALMEAAQAQFPHTFVTVLWGMTEGGLVTCVRESPREKAHEHRRHRTPGARAAVPRSGGRHGAGGRGRRARDAGTGRLHRLFRPAGPLRIPDHGRRVLSHRRSRADRRGRVRAHHRETEGSDHPRRRQHPTGADRERARRPSGRRRRGRHRPSRRAAGRMHLRGGGARRRGPESRRPRRPRAIPAPAEAPLPRGPAHRRHDADDAGGEDPQGRPPRHGGRRWRRNPGEGT